MTATLTLKDELAAVVKQLQDRADELDNGTRAYNADEIKTLTELGEKARTLKEQLEAQAKAAGNLDEARSFLAQLTGGETDTQGKSAPAYTIAGLPSNPKGKTLGEMFVQSDAFDAFRKHYGGRDGVIADSVKGIQSGLFQVDSKTLVTGVSDTSAGAAIRNDVYTPITDLVGERELTVADLVTRGTTESDTIEYVRITGKTNNAAPVAEATTAAAPTAPASGPNPLVNAAGGGYKPESGLALERVSTTVKTLAHWLPMTKRAASDAGQVRTLVDNFLRQGLDEVLETQMLTGDGTGENFQGILNAGVSTVGSAGTDLDAIVDAIRTVRFTGRRRPTAVVMHPNDWYSTGFLLAKDSQNRYLVGDPRATADQLNTLWGLRVVVSEAMTENTALVGDFRQAVLWEREGISISVSDSHYDFFTRNLLAILAEERAAFGVLDPQGFCTVTAV